jgi:putative CocE/NonD family hydrolase
MRKRPVTTAPETPHPVREIENLWIPLGSGERLAAKAWLPAGADEHPVPAIVEYLPYRKRDFTAARDTPIHRFFAAHGYASLRIDLRGSGESDGLMTDEYLAQELEDGVEAISWISRQPWCDGGVGMIGNSWGGFNGLQIAALRPPALRAIITSCSTDDRYADDMHYMGGALLTDMLDWGTTFFTWIARPPDPAVVGMRWREMWQARLENAHLMVADWIRHQRRDAFWKHGSVCEDYDAIEVPVFAVGGWVDGYSNAIPRLLAGLSVPRLGLIGPWAHAYPHLGVPGPRVDFLTEACRWWDHWLKGIDTGIMEAPMLRAWMQEALPARPFYEIAAGRWVAEMAWPSPRVESRPWRVRGATLVPPADMPVVGAVRTTGADDPETCSWDSPQLTGLVGGEWCPYGTGGTGPEFPGDQREDDGRSLTFDSDPLHDRIEILGAPIVELDLATDRPTAFVAVRLCDVDPNGASTRVTFGILQLSHRDGHEVLRPMVPGERTRIRVRLNDTAYAFLPGHRLRIALSTAYWPMVWPSPEPVTLTVWPASVVFSMPVRPPLPDETVQVEERPRTGAPAAISTVQPGRSERTIRTDLLTGETVVTNVVDGGRNRLDAIDLEIRAAGEDRVGIREDDPLSCWAESVRVAEHGRGDWQVRMEGHLRLEATIDTWRLTARLEAAEGDETVFARSWDVSIPRDHI